MKLDIDVALRKHVEFVLRKMDEIEACEELSIHNMADLDRYAHILRNLAQTHEAIIK